MTTATMPVPMICSLPDGWQPVDPERAGAPGVAFGAILPRDGNGPVPSITLGEKDRSDATTLDDIADEALGRLVRLGRKVSLVRRDAYESAVPALAQLAALTVRTDGGDRPMLQYQVFLELVGRDRRVVVETALTATPEQFERASQDFGGFVSSLRLDEGG